MQADHGDRHPSAPPARPTLTARPTPSELAARPRPRIIDVSNWLWLGTCLVGVITAAATLRHFDQLQTAMLSLVDQQSPRETPATRGEVATAALATLIGAGVLIILIQMALTIAMHSGRGWARFALIGSALLGALYSIAVFGAAPMMTKVGLFTSNVLMIIAGVSMFLPSTRGWFNQRRRTRPTGHDDSE